MWRTRRDSVEPYTAQTQKFRYCLGGFCVRKIFGYLCGDAGDHSRKAIAISTKPGYRNVRKKQF